MNAIERLKQNIENAKPLIYKKIEDPQPTRGWKWISENDPFFDRYSLESYRFDVLDFGVGLQGSGFTVSCTGSTLSALQTSTTTANITAVTPGWDFINTNI